MCNWPKIVMGLYLHVFAQCNWYLNMETHTWNTAVHVHVVSHICVRSLDSTYRMAS